MYDILKDIIFDEAQLKHYDSSKNSFYIKENSEALCKRIDLMCFESEETTFGFELDNKNIKYKGIHKVSPYFMNGKGFDKGNDGIIFTTIKDKHYVFICELKDGGKGFISQFKSSSCFVDYLKAILKRYYEINIDSICMKYIVFSNKGSLVQTTKGKFISNKKEKMDIYHVNCSRKKYYIESFI